MKRQYLFSIGLIVAIFAMAIVPEETMGKELKVKAPYSVVVDNSVQAITSDDALAASPSFDYIIEFSGEEVPEWSDTLVIGDEVRVVVRVYRPPKE